MVMLLARAAAMLLLPAVSGRFMPGAGVAATGWARTLVPCFLDKRSVPGSPSFSRDMHWDVSKFQTLLSWAPEAAAAPVDTLFDTFQFMAIEWDGGKEFEECSGACTNPWANQTDWEGLLDLQLSMGVAQLEAAAANVSLLLRPRQHTSPRVMLPIPYPSLRAEEGWGSLPDGHGGSTQLNFSRWDDRVAALRWFVDRSVQAFHALGAEHCELIGFYWSAEHIPGNGGSAGDYGMVRALSLHLHALGYRFSWHPYYEARGWESWRELGFDYALMQPNWAFCNESCADITAAERFARVANDTFTHEMGLVMEIPMDGVRNPQIPSQGEGGSKLDRWQTNMIAYADASAANGWQDHAIRSIYYGNSFVGMATGDPYPNQRKWYDLVYAIVKRTYPGPPPNTTWAPPNSLLARTPTSLKSDDVRGFGWCAATLGRLPSSEGAKGLKQLGPLSPRPMKHDDDQQQQQPEPEPPKGGGACTSAAQCQLNGVCTSSKCHCDAAWTGLNCSALDVLPSPIEGALYGPSSQTSSWSGGVVKDEFSTYHLWAAEMAEHCGLDSWTPNSMIRHATSSTPTGPFTPQEIVVGPFAYYPVPIRAPDGTWLIFKIGCGQTKRTCVILGNVSSTNHDATYCDVLRCTNGTTPLRPWTRNQGRPVDSSAYPPVPGAGPRGIAPGLLNVCNCSQPPKGDGHLAGVSNAGILASSPWGRWHDGGGLHQAGCDEPTKNQFNPKCTWPHGSMNNPAPVFETGGKSLAVMFRSWCSPSNKTHCENTAPGFNETSIGIARSPSGWDWPLKGMAWNITQTPLFDAQTEDYVWIDRRGHYHALFHHCFWPKIPGASGGHAFSADGESWEYSRTQAYGPKILQTDGSFIEANRERPHMLLEDGEPAFLYTAVIVDSFSDDTKFTGGLRDHSYTHAQPIRRTAMDSGLKTDDDEDPATPKWALFWCVADVRPGETLLCGLGGRPYNSDISNASLRIMPVSSGAACDATATLSPSGDAVSAVIPMSVPAGAYSVQLFSARSGSPLSNTYTVNAPELWWAQGDRGETATPGGWVRVFGRGLTLPKASSGEQHEGCASCELGAITKALARAGQRGDWKLAAALAAQAERMATQQHDALDLGTTLNLTSSDGHSFVLHATTLRLSTFSTEFAVPAEISPGNYSVSLSNGQAATSLSWFHSPLLPHKKNFEIRALFKSKPHIFHVSDFGCTGGIFANQSAKDVTTAVPVDCTAAVSRALTAAAQLLPAPSTVLFGAGRWYLQPPLQIPDGVTIAGESMSTTALYFAQTSINSSFEKPVGIPALIGPAVSDGNATTTFAVTDMCIYVLSFYSAVINISANTANVAIKRVRIRANAFNGRNSESRTVPWQGTIGGNYSPVIMLQGHSAEITDCDIYATWLAIQAVGHYGPTSPAHSVRFALIRNNTIWNGGACFWADQAKEVIFEDNTCQGISPMAGGNGIMTYGGGYAQHVWWGTNTVRDVWGNDREVMTFDNRGNQYFGPVVGVSSDGTNVSTFGRGAGFGNGNGYDVRGGALVVMNGTGAGQIRRIIDFSLDADLNGTGWFTIDAPFDVPLSPSTSPSVPKWPTGQQAGNSVISAIPFRGRSIFHRNRFEDTGAHQLYGIGLDTVVAENSAARFGGFVAYGQSRTGGYPPPKGTTAFFANPNVRNEWIGNRVTEGLRADHQGGPINVSGSFGDLVKSNGNAFVVATTWAPSFNRGCAARTVGSVFSEIGCRGMNRLLSFRRNSVDSCGGFQIGSSTDVLLEGNQVHGTLGSSIGLNSTESPFQISAGAMGCISRGNVHDGVESSALGDKGAALLKTDDVGIDVGDSV